MIPFTLECFSIKSNQDLKELYKYKYSKMKKPYKNRYFGVKKSHQYGYIKTEKLYKYGYPITKKFERHIQSKHNFQILIFADKFL